MNSSETEIYGIKGKQGNCLFYHVVGTGLTFVFNVNTRMMSTLREGQILIEKQVPHILSSEMFFFEMKNAFVIALTQSFGKNEYSVGVN